MHTVVRHVARRVLLPHVRFNHVRVAQLTDTEHKEQTMSRLRSITSKTTITSATPSPISTPTPAATSVVSAAEYRDREEITLKMPRGVEPVDPIQTFASAPDAIRKCVQMTSKFGAPTSIQAQAWPLALAGHDLVSIARTGSGKTLGFLLPVFNHISKLPRPTTRGYGPVAVILAPTRELAQQIEAEAKQYSNFPLVCAFGGVSKVPQIQKLKQGVDIIIATPGRLNDLLSMDFPATNLNRCSFLVLDEADRMLDMGFEPQLRDILTHMRDQPRQTLMFSATWPKEVRSLAMDFLSNPAQINIGGTEMNVCPDVNQAFHECTSGHMKTAKLLETVKDLRAKNARATAMIFCNTKLGTEQVCEFLREQTGIRANTLHGDKSQDQRDWALSEFRSGRAPVIVCTDVAARGIDVKNVSCVINYDFPSAGVQDWIHRVGRTGRSGVKGEAVTLISPMHDAKAIGELGDVLAKANQKIPQWLSVLCNANRGSQPSRFGGKGGFGKGSFGKSAQHGRFGGNSGKQQPREEPQSYGYGSDVSASPPSWASASPRRFQSADGGFKKGNLESEDRSTRSGNYTTPSGMRRINLSDSEKPLRPIIADKRNGFQE